MPCVLGQAQLHDAEGRHVRFAPAREGTGSPGFLSEEEDPFGFGGGMDNLDVPPPPRVQEERWVDWEGRPAPDTCFKGTVFTDGTFYPCAVGVGRRAGWAVVLWDEDPQKRVGVYGISGPRSDRLAGRGSG